MPSRRERDCKQVNAPQVAEIIEINNAGSLGVRAYTFDGDTPEDARKAVRTKGDIVVSNPDMVHQSILLHHTKWGQFFETLKYVVINEMHTYRGVFRSHMTNVITIIFPMLLRRELTCSLILSGS